MMTYRPAPRASWTKEGEWHVLWDGDSAVYRFRESKKVKIARADGKGFEHEPLHLEHFRVGGAWTEQLPASCERTDGGYRFWSNGRWIAVIW